MPRRTNHPDPVSMKAWLDRLYDQYHRPEFLGTDPLVFVHHYAEPLEQEVVALIAASLAYGKVASINASIQKALIIMGRSPRDYVAGARAAQWQKDFARFRHRWTDGAAMIQLLAGMRRLIVEHGSLGHGFRAVDQPGAPITDTLAHWVDHLMRDVPRSGKALLADPRRGSACKRLHLYLRWMVRSDAIDPGCWRTHVDTSRLMMPLDTHIFRFCRASGFTCRRAADGKTVDEITACFRRINLADPVRYDFALTRPGITGTENLPP